MQPLWMSLFCVWLAAAPGDRWPGFRGDGTSVSQAAQLPVTWSDTENLAWSIDLQGYGQSSPVVWGPTAFVSSTAGDEKDRLIVTACDIATGKVRWQQEFAGTQKVKVSDYVSRGAPTPVVDAERVYVFFESGDLLALTHGGELVWKRSLVEEYGEFLGNHGVGASLAATQDSLIVLVDHSGPSYLLAVEKATGKNRWKVDREPKVSWSSPVVTQQNDQASVLVSSNGTVDSYDAATGKRQWWVTGIDGNTVASPTPLSSLVIIGSSKVNENLAIETSGTGDVTETAIRWRTGEATSSFGSPLIVDGMVYFVNRAGVLFALDLQTGEKLFTERLPDSCWASPIAADGRIYCFTTRGNAVVLSQGRTPERLSENSLTIDGRVYGVAAVDGRFLVRTGNRLLCLQSQKKAPE